MFLVKSESESSAGLNVAQVSLYRRVPACRRGARLEIAEILKAGKLPKTIWRKKN
jgi:hypothetical protein